MALSDTEIDRIRYHCGYNLLEAGAELYVGNVVAVFDTVIQTYARTSPATTSSTAVVAASTPTPATLTLVDATGFDPVERVVVDVDSRSEVASVQSRNVLDVTLLLTLAHTGTYPVSVFSGEAQIRYLLNKCEELEIKKGSSGTQGAAGLKRVDEVWFATDSSSSVYRSIAEQLMGWRDSLCNSLNVVNLWRERQSSGSTVSLY